MKPSENPFAKSEVLYVQGWGNILNLSVLLFFLAVQGQTGPDYSFRALSVTWRMQYALGLLPIMYMLAYRIFCLKESTLWQVLHWADCALDESDTRDFLPVMSRLRYCSSEGLPSGRVRICCMLI